MRTVSLTLIFLFMTATSVLAHHDIFGPVKSGDVKQVRYVLSQEPELANARSKSGMTPLHMAALLKEAEVAVLLLDSSADITVTDGNGNTALHLAAMSGSGDLIRTLLERGADRQVRNHKGQTALDICVESGREDLAGLLK